MAATSSRSKAWAWPAARANTARLAQAAIRARSAKLPRRWGRPEVAEKGRKKAPHAAVRTAKDQKKLKTELKKVEKSIVKLIEKEKNLDQTEFSILEKRIHKIDEFVEKTSSKAGAQDLLVERERIENRLGELKLRRDFLSKELSRFGSAQPAEA